MPGCCSARGHDEFFSDGIARRDARRYRRRGLDANAQRLVDFVRGEGVDGLTVLEVGGGVGAIQLELLHAGAAGSVNAELSAAYEPYAAELADEAGLTGRSERRMLDFARQGAELDLHPPAAVLAVAGANGLEPKRRHRGLVWEFAGLTRRDEDDRPATGST